MLAALKICIFFCAIEQPALPPPKKIDYFCEGLRQEMKILLKPLGKTGMSHDAKAALDSIRNKYHDNCPKPR